MFDAEAHHDRAYHQEWNKEGIRTGRNGDAIDLVSIQNLVEEVMEVMGHLFYPFNRRLLFIGEGFKHNGV